MDCSINAIYLFIYFFAEGFCNISNNLTITTKIDKMSDAVKSYATENNLWNGEVNIISLEI